MTAPRPAPKLPTSGGRPWLGVNYWSRTAGPFMWQRFDIDVIREELHILAQHGLTVIRAFLFWPHFMPEPDYLDDTCVARFATFLDLCWAAGIQTIPTFIVGHMSGENWDPRWRHDLDLYRDGWLLAQQAFYIREIVQRFKDHPAIVAWLISNEVPIYGGSTDARYGKSWAEITVQAVRAAGAHHPVSLGDGAWGIEVTGNDNGFRLRDLIRTIDFVGPHVYPMSDDEVRQNLTAAFTCELCHFGKPVLLEEFGCTTDFVSEENAAVYYRHVLHSTLLAGAVGWLAWNNTDFDLPEQDPYRHHPFEQHFGVTDVTGRPKAPLIELHRFRTTLDRLEFDRCTRTPTEVALLISSYFDTAYPFTNAAERPTLRQILLQTYCTLRLADLAPLCIRELDDWPQVRLLLCPSTKALTTPTWNRLEAFAAAGSTVYVSYFPGVTQTQRGPWWPMLNQLFGVRHLLRYGLTDPVEDDEVVWTFEQPLGDLPVGTVLRFRVSGNENGRAFLPVEPTEATVIARDQHGRPALLVRPLDKGQLILATFPIEYFAASRPRSNPDASTITLYRALARLAGATPPVTVPDADVWCDRLIRDDGTEFLWIVSHRATSAEIRPATAPGLVLEDLESGAEVDPPISLPPYGVATYRVRR
ncbi:cellulase family glycosylhydrolase [Thermomicrobium sp. 4228-Ro]|uniref:cellulase family glycosylhydrolase n=1 Tax=Thermomicrobium sp. 4228-Ro TaxID=2993937 RepID=UPI002248B1DB|nr:cellulase family glycosylhydrolase [Thermomicrobium sp. 4228-Ro]MCX2728591.1 cellulase family glycosylhydrolase [Thermomicrobium sp. 4228-Ro]